MKYFIIFVTLLILPLSAHAQTPINKDMANAYYENCVAKQDPRMTPDSQQGMCACTSVKMMEALTAEDIAVMGQNDQTGRNMLNKMLLDVYAPCMQYPVEDMVTASCLNDDKIDMMGLKMDRNKLCGCMAEKTGAWFSDSGRELMAELIAADPNITDPISPVIDSRAFKEASYDSLVACMNGSE